MGRPQCCDRVCYAVCVLSSSVWCGQSGQLVQYEPWALRNSGSSRPSLGICFCKFWGVTCLIKVSFSFGSWQLDVWKFHRPRCEGLSKSFRLHDTKSSGGDAPRVPSLGWGATPRTGSAVRRSTDKAPATFSRWASVSF